MNPFSILPALTKGMDGPKAIVRNLEKIDSEMDLSVVNSGDGVDLCIYACLTRANMEENPMAEALDQLNYAIAQLTIFRDNLKAIQPT